VEQKHGTGWWGKRIFAEGLGKQAGAVLGGNGARTIAWRRFAAGLRATAMHPWPSWDRIELAEAFAIGSDKGESGIVTAQNNNYQ
jgi:hypothetical protein